MEAENHQAEVAPTTLNQHQKHSHPANQTAQAEDLKRDILETAIKGRENIKTTQDELNRQGVKLKDSFALADKVATQTVVTRRALDNLVVEAKISKFRRIVRCCCDACCSCCCPHVITGSRYYQDENLKQNEQARLKSLADMKTEAASMTPNSPDDNDDNQQNIHDQTRMNKILSEGPDSRDQSWKRTLEPFPSAMASYETDMWYRQVDASLSQLQQMAEDMGQSLEEQTRLANMLTIYLNYGLNQVTDANENLNNQKALFL